MKFGRVVSEISKQIDRQTDRQTHHNTPHPYWRGGEVINLTAAVGNDTKSIKLHFALSLFSFVCNLHCSCYTVADGRALHQHAA